MTVAELIQELQKQPQEASVAVSSDCCEADASVCKLVNTLAKDLVIVYGSCCPSQSGNPNKTGI